MRPNHLNNSTNQALNKKIINPALNKKHIDSTENISSSERKRIPIPCNIEPQLHWCCACNSTASGIYCN